MDHSRLGIDVGFIPDAANNVPCDGRGDGRKPERKALDRAVSVIRDHVTGCRETDLSVRLKNSD